MDSLNNISNRLAKFIKSKRKENNLTQEQLSEISTIDYKQIQNLESLKKINNPRLSTFIKLSKAFNISVEKIISSIFKK